MKTLLSILFTLLLSGVAFAAETVGIRVGEHPTHSRMVFDWQRNVPYAVEQSGNTITLTFEGDADFDLGKLQKDPSPMLKGFTLDRADGKAVFRFEANTSVRPRHFRDGPRIVFDLVSERTDAEPPKKAAEAKAPEAKPAEAKAPEARSAETKPVVAKTETKPAANPARTAAPAPKGMEAAPVAAPVPMSGPAVVPVVRAGPDGAAVLLPVGEGAGVAAWRRAGLTWIVFDRPGAVDLSPLQQAPGGIMNGVRQQASTEGIILSFQSPPDANLVFEPGSSGWTLQFTRGEGATAPTALDVRRDSYATGGPRIVIPGAESRGRVMVTDTEVGDRLTVVPVALLGRVEERREFSQVAVLPSLQGVIIEPLGDGVQVQPGKDIEVAMPGGLILSGGRRTAGDANYTRPVMLRIEAWRGGDDPAKAKQNLLRAVAEAPAKGRNSARLDLARFHLAHGQDAEALGILAVALKDDPTVERTPGFRALRGVAYLMHGAVGRAANDLNHPSLDNDAEFALWRGRVAAQMQDWPAAVQAFRAGSDALSAYPPDWRAPFRIDIARAFLKAGNAEAASAELEQIVKDRPAPRYQAEAAVLRSEVAMAKGDRPAAKAALESAKASPDRRVQVLAELAAVDGAMAAKEIDAEEAVKRLEKLRFAWRGDALEFEVLRKIGLNQIAAGDVRGGMGTLKQAVTLFPRNPDRPLLTQAMGDTFAGLFSSPSGAKLSPVQALALYQEFRELTPPGQKGDEMIERLAERLIAVDLLDKAAELTEQQVNFRLQGDDKVRGGNRLAMMRLLDRKPTEALKALASTAQPSMPPELAAERRILEARALSDLGRAQQALAALGTDSSNEAMSARADILWKAQDWKGAVEAIEAQLARVDPKSKLTTPQRRRVLQLAIATSLSGDAAKVGAVRERYASAMAGSPEGEAFKLASGGGTDPGQARQIAGMVSQASQIEAQMSSYRERLSKGALSAVN